MKFGTGKPNSPPTGPAAGPHTRHSSGLDQFCTALQQGGSHSVLDLSGASQANITFITTRGHRISTDDVFGTMQQCFGTDFLQGQASAANAQRFLDQTLTFPDESFDGALAWDALQFLTSPLLEQVVSRLMRVMRRGGLIFALFNAEERAPRLPLYNYRIQDQKTLLQMPRGVAQPGQYFPNRTIEKLFEKASSLKFFLTRDSLREVIVRK